MEYPKGCAHTLFKALDVDPQSNGMISREEWRMGWRDGALQQIIEKESAKSEAQRGKELQRRKSVVAKEGAKELQKMSSFGRHKR
jgi:hypothetical protein